MNHGSIYMVLNFVDKYPRKFISYFLNIELIMNILISLTSSVIANLCNAAIVPLSLYLSNFTNSKRILKDMEAELQRLKEKRDDLARRVEQIQINGAVRTNQVKGWFERVEAIEGEATLFLSDLEKHENRCFTCYSSNCSTKYMVCRKAPRILEKIRDLKIDADSLEIEENVRIPPPVETIPHVPTVGLETMLEKVQKVLADDEIGRIGIYGMGGVGKTTLIKSINNEFLKKNDVFDVVICVFLSQDFVIEKIQEDVGRKLGITFPESENQQDRSSRIFKILERKKFLLLLDNVWKQIELSEIGIPYPDKENKCKLILTTRSMDICSDMDAQRKLKHEILKDDDAFNQPITVLFRASTYVCYPCAIRRLFDG